MPKSKSALFEKFKVGDHCSPVKQPDVIVRKIKYTVQGEGPSKIGLNAVIVAHSKKDRIGWGLYIGYPDRTKFIKVPAPKPPKKKKRKKAKPFKKTKRT